MVKRHHFLCSNSKTLLKTKSGPEEQRDALLQPQAYHGLPSNNNAPQVFVEEMLYTIGFPGATSGKESTRHKRCWFTPWVGKIPWRKAQKPTPIFLTGESHGQRSLAGNSSKGHKESDMTEATQHAYAMDVCSSYVQLFVTSWTVAHQAPLCPWSFPGKNTGVGCHFLLQGIFPTQGSNSCLLHLLRLQADSSALASPALAGRFFTTGPSKHAHAQVAKLCLTL